MRWSLKGHVRATGMFLKESLFFLFSLCCWEYSHDVWLSTHHLDSRG